MESVKHKQNETLKIEQKKKGKKSVFSPLKLNLTSQ